MKVHAVVLCFALLVSCSTAWAGEPERPAAPGPKPERPAVSILESKSEHKFFDLKNSLAMGSFAVALAGDSFSTQRGLSRPGTKEINPFARLFVNSRTGAVVYSTGSFGLLMGGMYLAHKTGHHKLERIVPFGLAAWEGFLTYRNFRVASRPRQNF